MTSLCTPRTARKTYRCNGGSLVEPHLIQPGDRYVIAALPPHDNDIGNLGWWTHRYCLDHAPEDYMTAHPDLFTALDALDNDPAFLAAQQKQWEEGMAKRGLPVLPYAGSSGWAGTHTSREAAAYADTHGLTAHSQRGVIQYLHGAGARGATVAEIRTARPDLGHHGKISGALTALHMKGLIARLGEVRGHCKVYVLPDLVEDRPTEEHKANRPPEVPHCPNCGFDLTED